MEKEINEDDIPEDFIDGEIKNENPFIFKYIATNAWELIQVYGWVFVILIAMAFYVKSRIKFSRRTEQDIQSKKYDNDEVRLKHEAMDEARVRMQERHARQAEVFREEEIRKEEERRKERIEDWERHKVGMGYRSKYKHQEVPRKENAPPACQEKKKTLKPEDYSPLTGGASGSSYRPPARRTGGG